jgi:hypothetical protein
VLELPQDLRVRPAESLRKLERGLPVTFFERLRSGHARGVAYKKRIGEISSAAIQEQERTKPLDVGILAHPEVGERIVKLLLRANRIETRQ